MNRFWDWTLDHPWQFVIGYAVFWLALCAVLFLWLPPVGIGAAVGWAITYPRLLIQNIRWWVRDLKKEAYARGQRDAFDRMYHKTVADLYQRKVGSA